MLHEASAKSHPSKRNNRKKSLGSTKTSRALPKPASRPSSRHTAAVSGKSQLLTWSRSGPIRLASIRSRGIGWSVRSDRATRLDPRRAGASVRRAGTARWARLRRGSPSSGKAYRWSRDDGSTGCTKPRPHAPVYASWLPRNRASRDRPRRAMRRGWRPRVRGLPATGRCRDSGGLEFPAVRSSSSWRRRRQCRES